MCLPGENGLPFFPALSCWWTKAQRTGSGEWMMLLSINMVIPGQPCQWLEFSPCHCHIFQGLQFIVSAAYFIRIIGIFLLKYPKRRKILVPSLRLPSKSFFALPPFKETNPQSSQPLDWKILISCKLDRGKSQMQSVFCLLYMEIILPKCSSS